jgi:hypothetical protein
VFHATDPLDTPTQIVVRKVVNFVDGLAHWAIITNFKTSFANVVITPFAYKAIETFLPRF